MQLELFPEPDYLADWQGSQEPLWAHVAEAGMSSFDRASIGRALSRTPDSAEDWRETKEWIEEQVDRAMAATVLLAPTVQQQCEAKAMCGDALLLFRLGDFYELFGEDAKTAARSVGLTLTMRRSDGVPMAGFPHHQLEKYLARLIAQGFRVAVCEQVDNTLPRREITRVVVPGR